MICYQLNHNGDLSARRSVPIKSGSLTLLRSTAIEDVYR